MIGHLDCPERPSSDTPEEIGFRKAGMFRWLNPRGLLDFGWRAGFATILGRFADKRDMEAALQELDEISDWKDQDEVWIDYVADLGDGFRSTYAVATLLAREQLEVATTDGSEVHQTRRGHLLVLGGDEVYPAPTEERYENQFKGPYRAALPCTPEESSPMLFAVPGNHDWYDGLSTFLRLFCAERWIGGWKTKQSRSYFALQLPHGWWLWAIDIAFDFYIDEPQMMYFKDLADRIPQGSPIILCTAKPSWVHERLQGDESYKADLKGKRNLEFFEREAIRAKGHRLPLVLSGDLHHYARYESDDGEQRITSGGGGAFMHPTHNLPSDIEWRQSTDPSFPGTAYHRCAEFPCASRSRELRRGIFLAPFSNPGFGVVTAVPLLLLLWTLRTLVTPETSVVDAFQVFGFLDLFVAFVKNPASFLLISIIVVALIGFADAPNRGWRFLMGFVHTGAYLSVLILAIQVWADLSPWGGGPFVFTMILWVAVTSYLGGCVVMGLYLGFAQYVAKRHPNEAFSAMHIEDYKNFLRLKLDRDGRVTIYPVGLERVPRLWRLLRTGRPTDPWLVPECEELEPMLIEAPVSIPRLVPSGESTPPEGVT